MEYEEIVRRVEARAPGGLDQERAVAAIRATLATLAERVSRKEAGDLADQLPRQLAPVLRARSAPERFTLEEFLGRVAEREGVARSEAFDRTRAVMNVLSEAVSRQELAQVRADLTPEFDTLFKPPAAARWPETHAPRPHGKMNGEERR